MRDCLAYWETFWDRQYGPTNAKAHTCRIGYGSGQDHFLDRIAEEDNLWVVARSQDDTEWRLVQRLHVARTYTDKEGVQRVVADPSRSDFFDPETQADFEQTLKKLQFASNQPISATGKLIGRHIQTIRPLSDADQALLAVFALRLSRI
jgi:hypothetical protein